MPDALKMFERVAPLPAERRARVLLVDDDSEFRASLSLRDQ